MRPANRLVAETGWAAQARPRWHTSGGFRSGLGIGRGCRIGSLVPGGRGRLGPRGSPLPNQPRVRINCIGFYFESPDLVAFPWALAREHDDSFVGMSRS